MKVIIMKINQELNFKITNVLLNIKSKELNYRKVKREINQVTNIYKAVKKSVI